MRIAFGLVAALLLLIGLTNESTPMIGIGMAAFAFLIFTREQR